MSTKPLGCGAVDPANAGPAGRHGFREEVASNLKGECPRGSENGRWKLETKPPATFPPIFNILSRAPPRSPISNSPTVAQGLYLHNSYRPPSDAYA